MSNSKRAQDRRTRRSKLKKSQRDQLSKQHFGDKHSVRGHGPLRKGESKKKVLEDRKKGPFGLF